MNIHLLSKSTFAALQLGVAVSAHANSVNPAGPWYPFPNGGSPVAVGQELFASGGDVTVTFLGPTGASYDEHLFVASPAISSGPAAGGARPGRAELAVP